MQRNDVERAIESVRPHIPRAPRVALILGSGLASLVDAFEQVTSIAYAQIVGMPQASVAGHPGRLVYGLLEGLPVVALQGRLHPYEGHSLPEVALGVRLVAGLGASALIVTNAAGGLDRALTPGSLVAIRDHLNLTGQNCLVGPNDPGLGPRFPDLSEAYDAALRRLAHTAAERASITLHDGVYAGVLGPSYETPAEVKMLRRLGARVVGMSTVQEVIAARHLGLRVLGLSCVTNLAAGLSGHPLSHSDVERTARESAESLGMVVRGVLQLLGPGF